MPQWRRTIARSGLPPKAVTLINYERTKSLLAPCRRAAPASPTRAKNNELARGGGPSGPGRIVVFDESHRLRNPYSQQSMSCRQLADAADFRDLHERHSRPVAARTVLSRPPARPRRPDAPTETLAASAC